MCPDAVPSWLFVAGIFLGMLLMAGAYRAFGLKGAVGLLILEGAGAVWAIMEIIHLHKIGC